VFAALSDVDGRGFDENLLIRYTKSCDLTRNEGIMENEKEVIIVGAGGFARELLLALELYNMFKADEEPFYRCVGFLSDYGGEFDSSAGLPPIIDKIHGHSPLSDKVYLLGVGEPKYRRQISEVFKGNWDLFVPFLSRFANVNKINRAKFFAKRNIKVGFGSSVLTPGITVDVKIGNFVLINGSYSIGHEVQIGDFTEVGPLCAIGGRVVIEEGVHIGTGAIIAPDVKIGAWSKISAGAVVMKNLPPCSFVVPPQCKTYKDFFLPYDGLK